MSDHDDEGDDEIRPALSVEKAKARQIARGSLRPYNCRDKRAAMAEPNPYGELCAKAKAEGWLDELRQRVANNLSLRSGHSESIRVARDNLCIALSPKRGGPPNHKNLHSWGANNP
jgi:hypothetical protein